ncbi:MAG: DUF2946 family protein [Pseudorhodobacter sp.]
MASVSRFLRLFLLIALMLSGSVPPGMMRIADGDGMRLVLCTTEGAQEVWLAEDGSTTPFGNVDESQTQDRPNCVQVNLHAPGWLQVQPVPATRRERLMQPPRPAHQISHRPASARPQLSRAPPRLA